MTDLLKEVMEREKIDCVRVIGSMVMMRAGCDERKFACVDRPEFNGHLVNFIYLCMGRVAHYKDLERNLVGTSKEFDEVALGEDKDVYAVRSFNVKQDPLLLSIYHSLLVK